MDEKMIKDIDIVEAVIHKVPGYIEKNAWRRIKASISENAELKAELEHYKDAFKVVEAEMLERVPFEVLCRNCHKPHDGTCLVFLDFRIKQNCPLMGKSPKKEKES
jgi:hypothetical protein